MIIQFRLYQIGSKFRGEMRPKFGLIRANEFIMKDLYTFDKDLNSAMDTYHQVRLDINYYLFTYSVLEPNIF